MLVKVASIIFFATIGVLLINNGLDLGLSLRLQDLLRDVAGFSALFIAVVMAFGD